VKNNLKLVGIFLYLTGSVKPAFWKGNNCCRKGDCQKLGNVLGAV